MFVDSIHKSGIVYDFSKRRIFPLLQDAGLSLTDPHSFPDTVRTLLRANVTYCLHGDDSEYGSGTVCCCGPCGVLMGVLTGTGR